MFRSLLPIENIETAIFINRTPTHAQTHVCNIIFEAKEIVKQKYGYACFSQRAQVGVGKCYLRLKSHQLHFNYTMQHNVQY